MDRRIEFVLAQLANEFQKAHRVEDLAASVNLGKSRLEHLFKSSLRVSIRELLHHRRMSEAAKLLKTTFFRVSEICYLVGFHDPSNFAHAFRKTYGMSPREYRRIGSTRPQPDAVESSSEISRARTR